MEPMDREELHLAVEHVTGGSAAHIDLRSGAILWEGDGVEEPLPDDIDDEERYLPVPSKKELGLGRDDAITFTEEHAPQLLDRVIRTFNAAGAFDRFKALMHEAGLLPQWYAHQDERLWETIEEWAEEHGLRLPCGAEPALTRYVLSLRSGLTFGHGPPSTRTRPPHHR